MSAAKPRRIDLSAPGLEWKMANVGYGSARILERASLEVARGEFVGLIGPNGAGKSTLLRSVTGEADMRDPGALKVCGLDVGNLSAADRALMVGVVPQSLPELFAFTAREFVMMGRHSHLGRFETPTSHDTEVADRAMELTDTAKLADSRVDTLSGGDLQRLTLAQALAQEPSVLLLDEPTSHLDLNHRLQILDLVKELAEDGLAVLGVFHDLDLAARYSDRVAVVAGSTVSEALPPAEIITAEMLLDVFSVRAVVGTDAVTGAVSVTPVMREMSAGANVGPRVFVVAGSGAGADLIRQLVLAGYRVSAGALNVGDLDQAVAETLDVPHTRLAPFAQLDEETSRTLREQAAATDACIVCEVPFGSANLGNLQAAVGSGRPLVLMGDLGESRDFTGGEARRMWEGALSSGAKQVASVGDALDVLTELAIEQSDI